jgi:hypothetical protein
MIHFKNFCKSHNVPPPSTIQRKLKEKRISFSHKKNEILPHRTKWIELEDTILSQINQNTEK